VSLQNPTNPDHPKTKILEEFLEKLPPTPEEAKKNRFNLLNCLLSPTSFFLKEKKKKKNPPLSRELYPFPLLSSHVLSCCLTTSAKTSQRK